MLHQILSNLYENSKSKSFAVMLEMIAWSQAFDRQSHKLGIQPFIDNAVTPTWGNQNGQNYLSKPNCLVATDRKKFSMAFLYFIRFKFIMAFARTRKLRHLKMIQIALK
jgi:hypothetical protein